jgi:excisionase family DNA binding protein
MSIPSVLLDIDDVAKALRVSPHTVRRWASQGKLAKVKLGSRTLFDPGDVARFVERARAASRTIDQVSMTADSGTRR